MDSKNRPFKRKDRVSELIWHELGNLILREVEFEGAIVTITKVELSDKLDFVKIFVSILPERKEEEALRILNTRRPYLQSMLLRKINIRPMPTLDFRIDRGTLNAAGVEKALLEK